MSCERHGTPLTYSSIQSISPVPVCSLCTLHFAPCHSISPLSPRLTSYNSFTFNQTQRAWSTSLSLPLANLSAPT
ncbi:hypothetical protein Cob_v009139 [Colletotrichum orbiculare MAFF 240422]|uniref:Uncharacterized protein n=1 Tax=Colletotrichum orbiculare (strain 104-T / ATCC 96160 / CBS 514.97 / LARS 414 / MAFF 240422) TaxID=1213857 RepID=A0A484FJL9_COLOR|nr:hypothetical protein Cob_v009139 [Colletotrichum orbiculare MAFF 240422]